MTQEEAIRLAKQGHNIFLTGRAGTGKTYTLLKIIEELTAMGKKVAVTASAGLAATHINGKTIHSWAGIGIKDHLEVEDFFKIKNNNKISSQIKGVNVLIIDEVSMIHDYKLDMIHELLMFVRGSNEVFGGVQIILCGDFFQLPPVTKNGKTNYTFNAISWDAANLKICYLEKIYRQENDLQFIEILNSIRNNSITKEQIFILENLSKNDKHKDYGINLYSTNADVDHENSFYLNKIKEDIETFNAQYFGEGPQFDSLKKDCLAAEKLELKIGAKVMCIANNFQAGYCNGSLGKIVGFDDSVNDCPIIEVFKTKKIITIKPYTWKKEEDAIGEPNGKRTIASITQIPLKLAWAITIHKSQGCSFDYVNLDMSDVRTLNMGYVALSRVVSLDGLWLKGMSWNSLRVDGNIIKKDIEFRKKSQELENIS